MLDIKFIRENPDLVKKGIASKGAKPDLVDAAIEIDARRRSLQAELDQIKAEKNKLGKEINSLSADQKDARIAALRAQDVKADALEDDLRKAEEELKDILSTIPNLPDEDVPVGSSEEDNVVIKTVGDVPEFDFEPADYMTLAHELDMIDIERASKVSGTRFGYIKGAGAMLEFALVQYTLKILTDPKIIGRIAKSVDPNLSKSPFIPVVPPVLIRRDPYWKMARLTHEIYEIPEEELYLVGSAEHSLGPMHMDEIFSDKELPRRYLGFSTAFRRESGTYGKDTKGIFRVHQFDKLEMEVFSHPDSSVSEYEFVVACEEYLVNGLKLPYQVVFKSTADIGDPNARGIDLNIWFPSEKRYRETHTADFMRDYQTRRLNTRFRRPDGAVDFVHTIDATAFAIGRVLIAIIENYQEKDGSISVPKVLRPYLPFKVIRGPFGMN